ncbi:DoxX family protein [Nitrosomonas sp.]|uniref:DoxX family protein n=1 Tax=Nitrosomonas sp. TaxID=42353 RepID=UPI0035B12C28
MEKTGQLIARIFLAQIFLLSGIFKIGGYAGTQGYMEAMGVPGMLLPLVIALEIGGGLALIAGWQTKWISLALAGFTLVAAVIFHNNLADQMQQIMFMKNIAITGGLVLLAIHGAGALSVDGRRAA